jgi:hypothetical protein
LFNFLSQSQELVMQKANWHRHCLKYDKKANFPHLPKSEGIKERRNNIEKAEFWS